MLDAFIVSTAWARSTSGGMGSSTLPTRDRPPDSALSIAPLEAAGGAIAAQQR
jgi:hypothetical protein